MIRFSKGDMFSEKNCALVNPCNCIGVLGAGVAKEISNQYPEATDAYKRLCGLKWMKPGWVEVEQCNPGKNADFIVHFPTKIHWKDPSEYEYVKLGLDSLWFVTKECGFKKLCIPALGCGLGGLKWEVVKCMIEQSLYSLNETEIIVFEPKGF